MPGTSSSGGRGTNSKSIATHERNGTYRKDRHGALKNPEPTAGRPEPPADLDSEEQKAWEWALWAFDDMGMLTKVDAGSVYQFAKLFAETERVAVQQRENEASVKVLEENLSDVKGEDLVQLFGQIVTLRKLISKATDQLRSGRMAIRQYLVEFGLTPASRGRIKLPAKGEAIDEFTAFQKKRGAA